MLRFFSFFLVIFVLDMLILVKIGSLLGFWPTLALVVLPGLLGAAIARTQGMAVLSGIKKDIALGRMPGGRIIDSILIIIGGLLLIIPGIITDLAGLSVLIPGVRRRCRGFIKRSLMGLLASRTFRLYIHR